MYITSAANAIDFLPDICLIYECSIDTKYTTHSILSTSFTFSINVLQENATDRSIQMLMLFQIVQDELFTSKAEFPSSASSRSAHLA